MFLLITYLLYHIELNLSRKTFNYYIGDPYQNRTDIAGMKILFPNHLEEWALCGGDREI